MYVYIQMALVVNSLPTNACRCKRLRFHPWVRKIPWRSAWQPTPVFLPGELHRQRSLEGYRPGGRKESGRLKQLGMHAGT